MIQNITDKNEQFIHKYKQQKKIELMQHRQSFAQLLKKHQLNQIDSIDSLIKITLSNNTQIFEQTDKDRDVIAKIV